MGKISRPGAECSDLSDLDSKQSLFRSLLPSSRLTDGLFNSEDQAVALADDWPQKASLLAPGFGMLTTAGCSNALFSFAGN